jgi:hypothetical protein
MKKILSRNWFEEQMERGVKEFFFQQQHDMLHITSINHLIEERFIKVSEPVIAAIREAVKSKEESGGLLVKATPKSMDEIQNLIFK